MHVFLDVYTYCILKAVMRQCIQYNLALNWQGGRTALMYAAQQGHSNVVETLLQHGASVDMQNVVSSL